MKRDTRIKIKMRSLKTLNKKEQLAFERADMISIDTAKKIFQLVIADTAKENL